jgi:N-methylhydantoinase B
MVEEYAIRRGSAGAGRYRGGMGVRRVYRILDDNVTFNCYSDRFTIAPWGLFEGLPGLPSRFTIERAGETIALGSKVNVELQKGDRLIIETAGAGGYGDPHDRDHTAVLRDLENGFISDTEAQDVYGLTEAR